MTDLARQSDTLIAEWREGDESAQVRLVELLYPRLQKAASSLLDRERHVSLAPGDLVHEMAIRLLKSGPPSWENRAHFLAIASIAMRRVLIDHVRAKRAGKREHQRVTLVTNIEVRPNADVRALNHALNRLSAIDRQLADIVEMRYFGGMSLADIAQVTEVSEATVKRRWAVARAWLLDAIENDV